MKIYSFLENRRIFFSKHRPIKKNYTKFTIKLRAFIKENVKILLYLIRVSGMDSDS
jgi:hypothetical protein